MRFYWQIGSGVFLSTAMLCISLDRIDAAVISIMFSIACSLLALTCKAN